METPRSYQSDADIDQDVEKKVPYDGDIVYPSATTDSDHAPVMRRHLKSRHIAFIGLGGGIGVGLFVGVGKGLSVAGPLGLFLAFTIMGAIMWGVLQGAAEMAAVIPTAGGFPHFAARFIDPALGFALGWNCTYEDHRHHRSVAGSDYALRPSSHRI